MTCFMKQVRAAVQHPTAIVCTLQMADKHNLHS